MSIFQSKMLRHLGRSRHIIGAFSSRNVRSSAGSVGSAAAAADQRASEIQDDEIPASSDSLDDFVQTVASRAAAPRESGNPTSFATLFRRSTLVQLGDFDGRLIVGRIERRVGNDVYVDLGLKFSAVCQVPQLNQEGYVVGANVLLRLHDPELSERFLGSKKDLTLLEADATLVKLLPKRVPQKSATTAAEEST